MSEKRFLHEQTSDVLISLLESLPIPIALLRSATETILYSNRAFDLLSRQYNLGYALIRLRKKAEHEDVLSNVELHYQDQDGNSAWAIEIGRAHV